MKKLLMSATAIAGLATVAAPAMAEGLSLELGGFYRGYVVHADNDVTDERDIEMRQDSEIHFSAETTLDNGLTVGFHAEQELYSSAQSVATLTETDAGVIGTIEPGEITLSNAGAANNNVDEAYVYFSGNWGRVNLGREDGAQFLLQVAAPSADKNIDGIRRYIGGLNTAAYADLGDIDYANDMGEQLHKITYMTPKFNGFQAGLTYAPQVDDDPIFGSAANAPMATDNDAGEYEDLWEIAARWDGEFEGVSVSLGAGYGSASLEADAAGADDADQWNIAFNLGFNAFTFGAAYTEDNTGSDDADEDTYFVGLGYENGAYTAGLSYLNIDQETATGADEIELWTLGGTYTFGPGMSFRGTIATGEAEDEATSQDITQITLGTDISF